MIPFNIMPGAKQWADGLPKLVAHQGPLWVHGPFGSGVSTLAHWLADQRGSQELDSYGPEFDLAAWLANNPRGVVASERQISGTANDKLNGIHDFLELRLWAIDEDPSAAQLCLEHLAAEEGIQPPLPPALAILPCSGNLRELRNRVIRWSVIGQLPEPRPKDATKELFETEDIASNLHILERVLLFRALRRSYGKRSEAANRLGISRRQLYLLIERHGDPIRGQLPTSPGLKRLAKIGHNSSSDSNST
jgi:hypothetical protein